MKTIRKSNERGHANHGWLDSYHTFSFADYYDPQWMGYRSLRVINDDLVMPGMGFGTHPHRDMEIISYVLSGAIEHKDSMGNGRVIRAGEFQYMAAGTGVQHSEFNPSKTAATHFLQIWIQPDVLGIEPQYEEKRFDAQEKRGRLRLIVSPDRADGSLLMHQDARLHAGLFDGAEQANLALAPGRRLYVHLARGRLTANRIALEAGDALEAGTHLDLRDGAGAEVLVFDLPAASRQRRS
jgi:hypothetical protein